jgi:hypothetical protein
MRDLLTRTGTLALAAGAALMAAACGDGGDSANTADANNLDANLLLDQPVNDASAMEAAVNTTDPVVTDTGNQGTDSPPVLGNTSGGDTGGNTVGNVSAM